MIVSLASFDLNPEPETETEKFYLKKYLILKSISQAAPRLT
jgi:hypothetical protein